MATFVCEVFRHHRRADGSYPVKLRVTHNRGVKRLPTNLTAYPEDLTRSLKIKSGQLKNRCDALIKDCRDAVADLSVFDLPKMSVGELCDAIRRVLEKQDWTLDFFDFANREFLSNYTPEGGRTYRTALAAFARFLGAPTCDINSITGRMIQEFAEFLDVEPKYVNTSKGVKTTGEKKSGVSTATYVRRLGTIFAAARRKYNDRDVGKILIPRTPFEGLALQARPCRGQSSIGVAGLQALIDWKPDSPARQRARDIFLVSFALMGANVADLYVAAPPGGGVWRYNRRKTERKAGQASRMEVDIPAEIAPELERLTAGAAPGRWLNLSATFADKDYVSTSVTAGLEPFAREHGLQRFTLYAARHTWASLAKNKCGIDEATVDDCLTHSGGRRMAKVYIERDYALFNEANRKVLALFTWNSR